ncbi:Detected protein of confused Function [Hibiscus syriacus]|uniref:Detected protein of confused Function n=1 Tax=Hibiscus syriacus TaxID=106335 RepID=A0A6A2YI89_HIBSY|nr:Detected protein of confused Function [Hibiscus syriacus]
MGSSSTGLETSCTKEKLKDQSSKAFGDGESILQAPYAAILRLRSGYRPSTELQLSDLLHFAHCMEMPIAIKTDEPKTQHYELPTSFFQLVLGKNFKYSCCYFSDGSKTMDDAKEAKLELYCEISQLKDDHTVRDVGCGWGMEITECGDHCADISTFEMEAYDRIYYIGMFEDGVSAVDHWLVNGKHYAKLVKNGSRGWTKTRLAIKATMESTYGKDQAVKWTVYWRTFFIAIAELFGYNNGEEWMTALFLFEKK